MDLVFVTFYNATVSEQKKDSNPLQAACGLCSFNVQLFDNIDQK